MRVSRPILLSHQGSPMKLTALLFVITLIPLFGCSSIPESVKDDGREAAERAKAKAEKAYDDMREDMK